MNPVITKAKMIWRNILKIVVKEDVNFRTELNVFQWNKHEVLSSWHFCLIVVMDDLNTPPNTFIRIPFKFVPFLIGFELFLYSPTPTSPLPLLLFFSSLLFSLLVLSLKLKSSCFYNCLEWKLIKIRKWDKEKLYF